MLAGMPSIDHWLLWAGERLLASLRDLSYLALGEPSIDASRHPEVMMRYVCHHPDPARCNVDFRRDEPGRLLFATLRPVAEGDVFFIDYGAMYRARQGLAPRADA